MAKDTAKKRSEPEDSGQDEGGGQVVPLRQGVAQLAEMPQSMEQYGDVMGAGSSDDAEDRGTPLIYIAQKGHPQVDKNRPEYIEGLEVGMAFNPLTQHFWPETEKQGLNFLPCFFRKNWGQWVPRSEGGGFRGMHPWIHPLEVPQQFGAEPVEGRRDVFRVREDDTELVLTHHYFGIFPDTLEPGIIPMQSTNLKASGTMQAMINAAKIRYDGKIRTAWAFILPWRMRTKYRTNDKGSWYVWSPQRVGSLEDKSTWTPAVYGMEVFELCAELARSAARGEVRMAQPMSDAEAAAGDEDMPI